MVGLVSASRASAAAPPAWPSPGPSSASAATCLPGALIWVARWGWETINAVTGAYAVLTVLDLLFGIREEHRARSSSPCSFFVGLHLRGLRPRASTRCASCSKWSTYLFGAFSVLVLGYLIADDGLVAPSSPSPPAPTAMMIAGIGTDRGGRHQLGAVRARTSRAILPRTGVLRGRSSARPSAAPGIVVLPMVLMGAVMAVASSRPGLTRRTRCPSSARSCRSGSRCPTC